MMIAVEVVAVLGMVVGVVEVVVVEAVVVRKWKRRARLSRVRATSNNLGLQRSR